jgi:hypothetical protein
MAPFNQRQIGYIQAIAGRQQHRTLTCGFENTQVSSEDAYDSKNQPQNWKSSAIDSSHTAGSDDFAKSMLMHTWNLDSSSELAFDSRPDHVDSQLKKEDFENVRTVDIAFGKQTNLSVFDAPCLGTYAISGTDVGSAATEGHLLANPDRVSSLKRITPDGFLNSTNVRFRFTLPRDIAGHNVSDSSTHTMGQDHYEFRWIVWRAKRPTAAGESSADANHSNLEMVRDGCSYRNPGYDFFTGQTGRKRGFLGYTLNKDLDKDKIVDQPDAEAYSGRYWNGTGWSTGTHGDMQPSGEFEWTTDDIMTTRLNRDDYVIMKDVRFFLGKEHGKSHFEDTLHWDWNDPIDTPEENVLTSTTLNDKNYRWHCTLFGTSGGKSPCTLNVHYRWTTKMESG